jgi:hypothetical protein
MLIHAGSSTGALSLVGSVALLALSNRLAGGRVINDNSLKLNGSVVKILQIRCCKQIQHIIQYLS